jgi:uncharacterized cupredoxin-like copper-binding protein
MTPRSRVWGASVLVLVFAIASTGWHSAVMGAHHMSPARKIRIAATEFRFTPRKLTLQPGMYRFALVNRGKVFHNLEIEDLTAERAGRSDATDERHEHIAKTEAEPGKTGTATVMLEPGVYRFMCHVRGHRQAGMYGKLVVVQS